MKYDFIEEKDIPASVSFWQSPSWKHILLSCGQAKEVFYFGNSTSTWILIEIRSIGIGQYGAFSLGIESFQIWEDFSEFLSSLKQILWEKGVIFLQMEPIEEVWSMKWQGWSEKDEVWRLKDNEKIQNEVSHNPLFIEEWDLQKPYKKFLTPYTRVIDLSFSEEEILKQMHEKGRYNIRLAERRSVKVSRVSTSQENIDIWMSLLTETTSRDGFSQNSRKYYESFLLEVQEKNMGGLYFARFEDRIIAAGIFVFTPSRAIYYYGASSSDKEDRKQMAPYLLQWTAILEAKKREIPVYDFLGVADPEDPKDSLLGVTEFKEKFGGTRIKLPEKICIKLSWKYSVFTMIRILLRR
jgi:lipid II:glycine glycyltransferase (peptidoglycan interpeptide bridge formation enzyme)